MKRIDMKNLVAVYGELEDDKREVMIQRIKNSIKRRKNHLVEMMAIVEKNVLRYKQDFYIYDMEILNKNEKSYLWIVRDYGTHCLNLEDVRVEDGKSITLSHFSAIVRTTRIKGIYYVDNKTATIKKVNEKKAFSLLEDYFERLAVL